MEVDTSNEGSITEDKVDSRIEDKYTDPDKERPPVSERAKEVLGHNLNENYEGVER